MHHQMKEVHLHYIFSYNVEYNNIIINKTRMIIINVAPCVIIFIKNIRETYKIS